MLLSFCMLLLYVWALPIWSLSCWVMPVPMDNILIFFLPLSSLAFRYAYRAGLLQMMTPSMRASVILYWFL